MKALAIGSTVGALVLGCAAATSAQSLADVARQEEERRKTIATPGKVYTNESLRPRARLDRSCAHSTTGIVRAHG